MTLHSYPFYPDDWLLSETRAQMKPVARIIYRDLLDHCWKNGSLPNDESSLQLMASVTDRDWKREWPSVKVKFTVGDDGRLHHWKVDEKRPGLVAWNEQRRTAGRKSGEVRRKRTFKRTLNGRSTDVQTAVERQLEPSTSTTTSTTPPYPPGGRVWQPNWERLESEYPGELNKFLDCQLFLSLIETPEAETEFFVGLARWKRSGKWQRGYVHSLTTFLRDHIWQVIPADEKSEAAYPKVMM